jgi:hypothetical protein
VGEVLGVLNQSLDLNLSTLTRELKKAFGHITNSVGKNVAGTMTMTPTIPLAPQ